MDTQAKTKNKADAVPIRHQKAMALRETTRYVSSIAAVARELRVQPNSSRRVVPQSTGTELGG